MAEIIQNGIDPHVNTAAMMLGIGLEDFLELKQSDPKQFAEHRQKAKAVNFGVPGGLTAKTLANLAKTDYGVEMTPAEAEALRLKLIREAYPELGTYLEDDGMAILARNLRSTEPELWNEFDFSGERSPATVGGIRNVVRGKTCKANGTPYSSAWYERTWDKLIAMNNNPELAEELAARTGSEALCRQLFGSPAATLTGRIRASVLYRQARNTPFQGLAADGAKLALFELIRRGFRVVVLARGSSGTLNAGFVGDSLPSGKPISASLTG